ncbi:MAG TPA: sulfite exporter TauE/SafE family protein [Anaerolineales bacterium]|nr:sulfite exporter TauE/SafE family protein [Anaerolineales bacterium]
MLASLLLGLLGSLGHCVGMCGPVVFLFDRQPAFQNKFAWALAHAGRITSYSFLGIIFGAFGQALWSFDKLQAALSILFALAAFYLAAAFIGLVPSPELLFVSLTRRWGRARVHIRFAPGFIRLRRLMGLPPLRLNAYRARAGDRF